MCTNCKVSNGCACNGGTYLARCACEKNINCPACGHSWGTNIAPDVHADIFAELMKPDVLKKMRSPEYSSD